MKKLHKIGISILSALAPATALGVTLGVVASIRKTDEVVHVQSVLLPKDTTIGIDDSNTTLAAVVTPANATDKTLTWTSSNSEVISIDKDTGKMTFNKAGNSTITCTSKDGNKTSSCDVKVVQPTDNTILDGSITTNMLTGEQFFTITSFKNGITPPEEVIIPKTYDIGTKTLTVKSVEFTNTITEVKSIVVPSSVSTSDSLFTNFNVKGLTSLESVSFSDTQESNLTAIPYNAFSGLSKLKKVRLPNSINWISYYAFTSCSELTEVDMSLATNLERISDEAFYGCSKLKPVSLPDSIIEIASTSFPYNTEAAYASMFKVENVSDDIQMVYLKQDNKGTNDHFAALGFLLPKAQGIYDVNLTLDKDTKIIADYFNYSYLDGYAMSRDTYITNINKLEMNENLKVIGYDAFYSEAMMLGNIKINLTATELKFPSSLTNILTSAFALNTDSQQATLKNVTLNEGLLNIGSGAFGGQSLIEEITIPSTVEQIGIIVGSNIYVSMGYSGAFEQCSGLKSIKFAPNSKLKVIGDDTFANLTPYGEKVTKTMDVVLPDSVEEIGYNAFKSSFIPQNGFVIPSSCNYLGCYSLAFFNQNLINKEDRQEPINITLPSSIKTMTCPFGYTNESEEGSYMYPVVSNDTLTFAAKSSQWYVAYWPEVWFGEKPKPYYEAYVNIDEDGKLSQSDYDKFMGGIEWIYKASKKCGPYNFDWEIKS